MGVLSFFYRADLFEQYGVEVPTTWDEYVAAAEAVKAADPNVRIGATTLGDPALYAALAWQHGATWASVEGDAWKIDIDSAETAERSTPSATPPMPRRCSATSWAPAPSSPWTCPRSRPAPPCASIWSWTRSAASTTDRWSASARASPARSCTSASWFIDGVDRGVAFVNGFCLGRFDIAGPQTSLYVPWPIVAEGDNAVTVVSFDPRSAEAPAPAARLVQGTGFEPRA